MVYIFFFGAPNVLLLGTIINELHMYVYICMVYRVYRNEIFLYNLLNTQLPSVLRDYMIYMSALLHMHAYGEKYNNTHMPASERRHACDEKDTILTELNKGKYNKKMWDS